MLKSYGWVSKNMLETNIKLEKKETGRIEEWREGREKNKGRQAGTCLTSFLQPSGIV